MSPSAIIEYATSALPSLCDPEKMVVLVMVVTWPSFGIFTFSATYSVMRAGVGTTSKESSCLPSGGSLGLLVMSSGSAWRPKVPRGASTALGN